MNITNLFDISKKHRSQYRWDSVLYFFKNYETFSNNDKLGFVLESLQTIAWCWIDVVKSNDKIKLWEKDIAQLFSDMSTYKTNKKIVWSKLVFLANHYFNLIKNVDDINLDNVELFYKWKVKISEISKSTAIILKWVSWKEYSFIWIWSVHTSKLEEIEDMAELLESDYSKKAFQDYLIFKWTWQARRLLSNSIVIEYYTLQNDLEKVKDIKSNNAKILRNLQEKNDTTKDSDTSSDATS